MRLFELRNLLLCIVANHEARQILSEAQIQMRKQNNTKRKRQDVGKENLSKDIAKIPKSVTPPQPDETIKAPEFVEFCNEKPTASKHDN